MTVRGSAGFGGPWARAVRGASATTPATAPAVMRSRREMRAGSMTILRAKRRCTNRRPLYHFHASAAPDVPAGPIAEVGKQRARADLGLRPVGEHLELAALEPRGEIHRHRLQRAAAPDAVAQEDGVADVDGDRQRHEDAERGDDDEQRAPAHRPRHAPRNCSIAPYIRSALVGSPKAPCPSPASTTYCTSLPAARSAATIWSDSCCFTFGSLAP